MKVASSVQPGTYRLDPRCDLRRGSHGVVIDDTTGGIYFRCPCGEIIHNVGGHEVSFSEGSGEMTVSPSIGYREPPGSSRPQNWCHMFIRDGVVEMCSDAKCPGGDGSVL